MIIFDTPIQLFPGGNTYLEDHFEFIDTVLEGMRPRDRAQIYTFETTVYEGMQPRGSP